MPAPRTDLAALAARMMAQARLLIEATERNDAVPAELTSVRIARDLDALSETALRVSIQRARSAGHTWQQIGDLLGVSRQAAFQRYGRPIDPRTREPMNQAATE